ncbi:MAG: hypothetical protein WC648_02090 [Candidatus Paceibacterota bacterium]|jgi:hypothetical protein
MKKISILLVFIAIFAISATDVTKAQTLIETEASVEIGASLDQNTTNIPSAAIREKLRNEIELHNTGSTIKSEELKKQESIKDRAELLRKQSTTSNAVRARATLNASTSKSISRDDDNRSNQNKLLERIRKDIFEKQKNQLVQQLTRALNNLTQIRERIVSRMEKAEDAGRDMTKAKSALVTADLKFVEAKKALNTLISFSATTTVASTSVTASSSATTSGEVLIDINKPRQVGAVVIKALNDTRKALNDVVVAIAHAMGLGSDDNGKIRVTASSTTSTQSSSTQDSI